MKESGPIPVSVDAGLRAGAKVSPTAMEDIAQLLKSGRWSSELLDSIQEGIVICDIEMTYRLWNRCMERLTGQPAGEVLGRKWMEIHPFLKERGMDSIVSRVLAGQYVNAMETALTQKRTNWAGWISATPFALRNDKGEVIGMAVSVHDITRRKRSEEMQHAHLGRFQELFNENPQPMWVYDLEKSDILAVNEAAIRHYGYSRAEFLCMKVDQINAPMDSPLTINSSGDLDGVLDESRLWRHRTKDGRVIDAEINSVRVMFSNRRAMLVIANDVTERLKSQQSLRDNELKYRTLIESAESAIILVDFRTEIILEANRRSENLLSLPMHRIVGMPLSEIFPPELVASRRDLRPKAGSITAANNGQTFVWNRSGRRIPVDYTSTVIELGGRKVMQCILRDITERRAVEDSLARRNRQLDVLSRANRQINAVLEIPVILHTLVSFGMEMVNASGGMAGLVENHSVFFREYNSKGRWSALDQKSDPGQGVAGYVLASGLSYYSNEPARDPLVSVAAQQMFNLRNVVNVPVMDNKQQVMGCLEIHNTEKDRFIDETDLGMLEALASTAAIAIENARTLEARHLAEKRYRQLSESINDVLWMVDMNLCLRDVTPSVHALLGYTAEELLGQSVLDLLAPPVRERVQKLVNERMKPEFLKQKDRNWVRLFELEHMRRDGTSIWVEAKINSLFDTDGTLIGFAGITRDITERRKAQTQLERSLALHASTLESIMDGILVVDMEGRVTQYNHKFLELWRIPAELMAGGIDQVALEFVLSQLADPEAFMSKVEELYSTPLVESRDTIYFKDGRVFERYSRPQQVDGNVAGRVWSFRDVTGKV